MAIIQISKIQQRSGNLVDLPQLDEAEFGWASDEKKLFIGKETPNENIEVLTSYSRIDFDQVNGSIGNLNISANVANGEVLTYDGDNWVNRGGNAGGLINLGSVSNVKITGGAIGYVLETDGLGNLSWTPKSTIIAFIENVTQANPGVVTTTQSNFLTDGAEITITDAAGMTDLNGQTYFINVLTSNTFALYTDSGLTLPLDTSGFNAYSYTSVTGTTVATNVITVGDSSLFSLNQPVRFVGDLSTSGLLNNVDYYIKSIPTGTQVTVSYELLANGTAGTTQALLTTTGLSASMYATGGRVISSISGSGATQAEGSNTTIQFNNNNLLAGSANLTFDFNTNLLTLNGNANVGNLNSTGTVTGTQLISTSSNTAPLQVSSTIRVANLNVDRANIADFSAVAGQTTGMFYPTFITGSSTGNYALNSNGSFVFHPANGTFSSTLLAGTLTTAAQPNITSLGTLTSLTVSGNINAGNVIAGNFVGNIQGNVSGNLTVPGLNTGVVFNDAGVANTSSAFTFNKANNAVTVSGNISANLFVGNVTGSANTANSATTATTAGTVTTAAQPNITSVGTLTSLAITGNVTAGNANVTGNVTAGGVKTDNYYYANGVAISFTGSYSNANVASYMPTYNGGVLASYVQTGNITTGAFNTAGTITGNFTLTAGSRLQATYADLAEYYEADQPYEPGTVLEFGGEKEVTLATDETRRVAGVVTTDPAYIMNAGCPGHAVAIALQGRVPVKVRGNIKKGDMMISGGSGFARPTHDPKIGTVIGKALVDFNGAEGVIEIAIGRL